MVFWYRFQKNSGTNQLPFREVRDKMFRSEPNTPRNESLHTTIGDFMGFHMDISVRDVRDFLKILLSDFPLEIPDHIKTVKVREWFFFVTMGYNSKPNGILRAGRIYQGYLF